MTIRRHGSVALFDGGFAYSAHVDDASLLFTAGVSPLDANGTIIAPDDAVAQTRHAFALLTTLLDERGSTPADIAKLTVYVATSDRSDLAAVWEALTAELGDPQAPPAVMIAVTVLPYPGQRVELDAVAVPR